MLICHQRHSVTFTSEQFPWTWLFKIIKCPRGQWVKWPIIQLDRRSFPCPGTSWTSCQIRKVAGEKHKYILHVYFTTRLILGMGSANQRCHYKIMLSLYWLSPQPERSLRLLGSKLLNFVLKQGLQKPAFPTVNSTAADDLAMKGAMASGVMIIEQVYTVVKWKGGDIRSVILWSWQT